MRESILGSLGNSPLVFVEVPDGIDHPASESHGQELGFGTDDLRIADNAGNTGLAGFRL
jgi:hypothetical protein